MRILLRLLGIRCKARVSLTQQQEDYLKIVGRLCVKRDLKWYEVDDCIDSVLGIFIKEKMEQELEQWCLETKKGYHTMKRSNLELIEGGENE